MHPSSILAQPSMSTQAAEAPSPIHLTVSTVTAAGPSSTVIQPTAPTELDDSTMLAEAVRFEEAHTLWHMKYKHIILYGKIYLFKNDTRDSHSF